MSSSVFFSTGSPGISEKMFVFPIREVFTSLVGTSMISSSVQRETVHLMSCIDAFSTELAKLSISGLGVLFALSLSSDFGVSDRQESGSVSDFSVSLPDIFICKKRHFYALHVQRMRTKEKRIFASDAFSLGSPRSREHLKSRPRY